MPGKYVPPQLRSNDGKIPQRTNPERKGFSSRQYSQGAYQDGFRRREGNYSHGSHMQQSTDLAAVSYVEKQKSRGIDPFAPIIEEPKPKNDRFASWDFRSQDISSKSPLGFNGSVRIDPEEEKRLFSAVSNTGINFDNYDAIPVEVSGAHAPAPLQSFSSEEATQMLPKQLLRNLALCGYKKPTPVQKHSIPIALANRDLMACAQTGSGKTGGFLFPIISLLLKNGALVLDGGSRFMSKRTAPNALIIGPTRELVVQIYEEAEKFCYATGLKTVVCYGGASSQEQRKQLSSGCDIIVGTPGRLMDFMERNDISLRCLQQLVLDEADRMLDMGFEPSIRKIVHEFDMPRVEERRTFMFSATFPREIQKLASDFMGDYIFLTVGRVGSAAKDITQSIQYVEEKNKLGELINILNSIKDGLVLVFVKTKRSAENIQVALYHNGFPTSSIHGDRTQMEREAALKSFKTGETPILVATDVAARGLDIDNVTFVINYDLPGNIDDYVHRIGRTGRAGNKGTALSFFNDKSSAIGSKLFHLMKENNQEIPSWFVSYGKGFSSKGITGQAQSRDFRRPGQGTSFKDRNIPGSTTSSFKNANAPTTRQFNGGGRNRTSKTRNQGASDAW